MTAATPEDLQQNIPLAPLTWIKVGGSAKYFTQTQSSDEIVRAVRWAREKDLSFVVIGGGSNVLISDDGFDGLVIRATDSDVQFNDTTVRTAAGANLTRMATLAGSKGLSGMEFAVGIPGTVGGAVRGNAGAFDGEMKDNVTSVTVLDENGNIVERPKDDLDFRYRHSRFKTNGEIILSATMVLSKGNPKAIRDVVRKRLDYRRERQPLSSPSLGSTFKNVPVAQLADPDLETRYHFSAVAGRGTVGAGYIIDQLGLKGTTVGGAQVSKKHANFIINTGGATAEHVIMLMGIIQHNVQSVLKGLHLEPEIQLLGF